jgi:hypothetical protein
MNLPPTGLMAQGSAHRQAALALHAMNETDRAWALRCLSPAAQAVLRELLDELKALGIPRGLAVPKARRAAIRTAHVMSATHAMQVLGTEPDALIARILALQDWTWRIAFLALLGHERAGKVLAFCVTPAPALDAALLRAFEDAAALVPVRTRDGNVMGIWVRTVHAHVRNRLQRSLAS